jgi:uncharacterized protein
LGILAANVNLMLQPVTSQLLLEPLFASAADRVAAGVLTFFAIGKFYVLFSLMFGFGFSLQLDRLMARAAPTGRIFSRRLLLLFVFGCLHGVFVWAGDILMLYAFVGAVLYFARRMRARTALMAGVTIFLGGLLLFATLVGIGMLISTTGEADPMTARISRLMTGYQAGYLVALKVRLVELVIVGVLMFLMSLPVVVALFLLGMYAERSALLQRWEDSRSLRRRWLFVLAPAAIVVNAFVAAALQLPDVADDVRQVASLLVMVGGPLMTVTYVVLLVSLWRRARGARVLRWLAPVGRMALTNYILQSVIVTLLANGYGLGWMGTVGPFGSLFIIAGVLLLEIAISNLWMRYFQYGPLEWVWRCGTYWQVVPIRKGSTESSPAG